MKKLEYRTEWVEIKIKLYTILNKHADKKDFYWTLLGNDLEDFISKTLQQQREEILEEIESNYLMPNGGIELQYLEWEQFKEENK